MGEGSGFMEHCPFLEVIPSLPHSPGVYLLKNRQGSLLYVGKAKDLRSRVRSYARVQDGDSEKTVRMKGLIWDVEYIVVRNETEALVLEQTFIKTKQPKFNILLKDDKKYLYIRITSEERFPRIFPTRDTRTKKTSYFGPFTSGRDVYATVKSMRKLFRFRTCKPTLFAICAKRKRPCLDAHIGLCTAPCVGSVSHEAYVDQIAQCRRFLLGQETVITKEIETRMKDLAALERFEEAAFLRDQLAALQSLRAPQQAMLVKKEDLDVFAIAMGTSFAVAEILVIREGNLIDRKQLTLDNTSGELFAAILQACLFRYYEKAFQRPREVLLPVALPEQVLVEHWFAEQVGERVPKLIVPQRGEKQKLVALAQQNAEENLRQQQRKRDQEASALGQALHELQEALGISQYPQRIECYDISHLGGTNTVGSMVVFEDGKPKKAHYRKFTLKQAMNDDYRSLQEVLRRRLVYLTDSSENGKRKDVSFASQPDLLLIDGGKGQLHAVEAVLEELELLSIPVASIAKREEELFCPGKASSYRFSPDSPALFLVQRIRDEAHRFAITFQRSKR